VTEGTDLRYNLLAAGLFPSEAIRRAPRGVDTRLRARKAIRSCWGAGRGRWAAAPAPP